MPFANTTYLTPSSPVNYYNLAFNTNYTPLSSWSFYRAFPTSFPNTLWNGVALESTTIILASLTSLLKDVAVSNPIKEAPIMTIFLALLALSLNPYASLNYLKV